MAIELISTVKPKNGGQFPIVEANDIKGGYYSVESIEVRDSIPDGRRMPGMLCYVWGDRIYKLGDDLRTWKTFTVDGGSSGSGTEVGSNGIWIGTSEPPDDTFVLWIDTRDEGIDESFSSSVINEFKSILNSLTNRIVQLESDVSYLMELTGGDNPDIPDIPDIPDNPVIPPTPTTSDTLLVNEKGFILVNEKGQILCGNTATGTITRTNVLVNESGSMLTNEKGQILCLDLVPVDNTQIMVNENNDIFVNENGDILCFHIGTSSDTDKIMVNENGQILVNENGDVLCLDLYNMLLANENGDILVNEDNKILKL